MRVLTCFLLTLSLVFLFVAISVAEPTSVRDFGATRDIPDRLRHVAYGDPHEDDEDEDDDVFVERFVENPLGSPGLTVSGEALERVTWQEDPPAFPGDVAGSLTARYDASLPAGLFGFALPRSYHEGDSFTAAAVFVIDPDTFDADPNGFFQISWGLWNSVTTGLDRTGDFTSFATDTFELIEFDYFPNVSPYFGGPFVAPAVFGVADPVNPDFETSGAFANLATLFDREISLPFGVPLMVLLEHRPELDALVFQIYHVESTAGVLPLDGAVGVVPLDALSLRAYEVDTVGLTLWQDGFGGATPAVVADLTYHTIVVIPGLPGRPEDLLDDTNH